MTLPPEKIGDKGRRFEILYIEGKAIQRLGWADKFDVAVQMRDAWRLRPNNRPFAWINDREAVNDNALSVGAVPVDQWPIEIDEEVELYVVHPNAQYATRVEDLFYWCGWCRGRWIDHNGGGWTWNGHCGRITHVRPVCAEFPEER
jgi:hypothetical protein